MILLRFFFSEIQKLLFQDDITKSCSQGCAKGERTQWEMIKLMVQHIATLGLY